MEGVEPGQVGRDTGDVDDQGQDADGEQRDPCKHEPATAQARLRFAWRLSIYRDLRWGRWKTHCLHSLLNHTRPEIRTCTRVPVPGALSISNVPPRFATRSRIECRPRWPGNEALVSNPMP